MELEKYSKMSFKKYDKLSEKKKNNYMLSLMPFVKWEIKDGELSPTNIQFRDFNYQDWSDTTFICDIKNSQYRIKPESESEPSEEWKILCDEMTPEIYFKLSIEKRIKYMKHLLTQVQFKFDEESGKCNATTLELFNSQNNKWVTLTNFVDPINNFIRIKRELNEEA